MYQASELDKKYKSEKKDKELVEQKFKIQEQEVLILKRQRQSSIFFVSTGVVLLGFVVLLFFYKNKQRLKTQEIKHLKVKNQSRPKRL
jgi:hypothetical protein